MSTIFAFVIALTVTPILIGLLKWFGVVLALLLFAIIGEWAMNKENKKTDEDN